MKHERSYSSGHQYQSQGSALSSVKKRTSESKASAASIAANVRASYMCRKCKAHGFVAAVKRHKKTCPYLTCACRKCKLVDQGRMVVAKQIALYRDQKSNGNEEETSPNTSSNASKLENGVPLDTGSLMSAFHQPSSQMNPYNHPSYLGYTSVPSFNSCMPDIKPVGKLSGKSSSGHRGSSASMAGIVAGMQGPQCRRCRNHNVTITWKGHKKSCPYRCCPCEPCNLIIVRKTTEKTLRDLVMPNTGNISLSSSGSNHDDCQPTSHPSPLKPFLSALAPPTVPSHFYSTSSGAPSLGTPTSSSIMTPSSLHPSPHSLAGVLPPLSPSFNSSSFYSPDFRTHASSVGRAGSSYLSALHGVAGFSSVPSTMAAYGSNVSPGYSSGPGTSKLGVGDISGFGLHSSQPHTSSHHSLEPTITPNCSDLMAPSSYLTLGSSGVYSAYSNNVWNGLHQSSAQSPVDYRPPPYVPSYPYYNTSDPANQSYLSLASYC